MEYKRIEKKGFNLHFIKTDRFKKINIRVVCKRPIKKEEVTIRNVATDILLNSSKDYPSVRDVVIRTEELYNFGASSNSYKSGNYLISAWSATFLNEKYTEEGMTDASIAFFMNLLFNPNVQDNKFDSKAFLHTKECIKNAIESIKDNPGYYSQVRMLELMYPNSIVSLRADGYLEDLNLITEENAYQYYKSMMSEDVFDIFVLGDFDFNDMETYIDKYVLLNRTQPKYNLSHFLVSDKVEEEHIYKEQMDINQSKLAIGLKIDDMTDYEKKYTLQALAYILGGSGDSKLFRKVRGDNSLCYYIKASPSILNSYIIITSGIDKNDFDKVVSLVKEVLDEVKDGNITSDEIENGLNTYINSCISIYDSPSAIINSYLGKEYLNTDDIDTRIEEMKKMNVQKIAALANKMRIDTIYLLEGESNDAE